MTLRLCGLLAAVTVLASGPALATTLTDSQILGQFNLVVFGDFSANSEVEGRTVVGGNLTYGSNFEIQTGLEDSSFGALTVYGSVTTTGTLNVDNGGSVQVGSNNSANFTMSGGSIQVGGNNSGTLATSGASGSVSVGGSNTGSISVSNGGSVYVGNGNASGGSVTVNNGGQVDISGNNAGTLSLSNGTTASLAGSNTGTVQLNGGSLTYTGSLGTVTNANGGTTTQASSAPLGGQPSTLGSFASTFQTQLTALSAQLAGVAANSTATTANGVVTFNAAPNSSGVAVFNINSSLFTNASTVTINLNGATSVIINVDVSNCQSAVCTFNPTANFESPTDYASAVLWNFTNATNLDFDTEFGGSILAPDATLDNASPIDGTVVVASDSSSSTGEIHSYPYSGTLPGGSTSVPEPGSLALVGSGLAGLALVGRRRRVRRGDRQASGARSM